MITVINKLLYYLACLGLIGLLGIPIGIIAATLGLMVGTTEIFRISVSAMVKKKERK